MTSDKPDELLKVRILAALVILLGWLAAVTASLARQKPMDPWIHILVGSVLTGLFGPSIWRRNGGSGGDKK